MDPLLGSDREASNETTAAARQQAPNKQKLKYNKERCSLHGPCQGVTKGQI
jgi:hypothetical protein